MKKRLMCLAMALLMCGTQVVSVSASRRRIKRRAGMDKPAVRRYICTYGRALGGKTAAGK